MKPSTAVRFWLHALYWLPIFLGVLLLVYSAVPHLWFVYDGTAHETMSLFHLVGNTWKTCGEASSGTVSQTVFCWGMRIAVIAFWTMWGIYLAVTVLAAVCSLIAFSNDPFSPSSNRAKKTLFLLCPNRICWCLTCLLPLFCGLFPQLLLLMYRTCLSFQPRMYSSPLADWGAALLAASLSVGSFLGTLRLQKDAHMELFCLYRKHGEGTRG